MKLSITPLLESVGLCLTLCAVACGSGGGSSRSSGAATGEDFTLVLADTVNNVIVPTYASLHARAADMSACVAQLEATPDEAQLTKCRNAWIAARVPWEQSEGFLFGPVTDEGLDPAMDTWPVDHQQLNALLASTVELSADSIASNLGGGLKGFHTIEYLLWGMNHERTASDLASSPREMKYLLALTEALSNDTKQLVESWTGIDGKPGFGQKFAAAGTSAGLYSLQIDAVQELIGGMIEICDEVAFGKIAEPYKARDPNLVESQFSYNSLLDFADNIRSIQNIYFASRDQTPAINSLSKIVAKYAPEADARIIEQIDRSIGAIQAIGADGVTFRDAVMDSKYDAVIVNAQTEIGTLMDRFSGEVLPLFAR
jgi:predicted lipoprotein